jgi:dodecin
MTVAKVIEIIGEGKSIEAALESAIHEAAKTLKNVVQIDVDHVKALVEHNKITKYRVSAKISFIVEH